MERKPKIKHDYSCDFSLDIWSDSEPEQVLGYFAYIINKFPKDIFMVEPSDLFIGDEDYPHGKNVDLPEFSVVKKIKTDGKTRYNVIYWVCGRYENRNRFIKDMKTAIKICNDNGIATMPFEHIEIDKITGEGHDNE